MTDISTKFLAAGDGRKAKNLKGRLERGGNACRRTTTGTNLDAAEVVSGRKQAAAPRAAKGNKQRERMQKARVLKHRATELMSVPSEPGCKSHNYTIAPAKRRHEPDLRAIFP